MSDETNIATLPVTNPRAIADAKAAEAKERAFDASMRALQEVATAITALNNVFTPSRKIDFIVSVQSAVLDIFKGYREDTLALDTSLKTVPGASYKDIAPGKSDEQMKAELDRWINDTKLKKRRALYIRVQTQKAPSPLREDYHALKAELEKRNAGFETLDITGERTAEEIQAALEKRVAKSDLSNITSYLNYLRGSNCDPQKVKFPQKPPRIPKPFDNIHTRLALESLEGGSGLVHLDAAEQREAKRVLDALKRTYAKRFPYNFTYLPSMEITSHDDAHPGERCVVTGTGYLIDATPVYFVRYAGSEASVPLDAAKATMEIVPNHYHASTWTGVDYNAPHRSVREYVKSFAHAIYGRQ